MSSSQAVSKQVSVSIKGTNDLVYTGSVVTLNVGYTTDSGNKKISAVETSSSFTGNYSDIQLRFTNDSNWIYTKAVGSEDYDETNNGNFSQILIDEQVGNAPKVIQVHESTGWKVAYKGNQQIAVVKVGGGKTEVVDKEGIQNLYVDDVAKAEQQFFLSRDGPNHARVDGKGTRQVQADGTVLITPDPNTDPHSARIYIRTQNPNAFDEDTQVNAMKDWPTMQARKDSDGVYRGGWALNDYDYRNTEVSHYYKIPTIVDDDEMTSYWRGGNHPHGGYPLQCISPCNKIQIQTKDCSPRSAIEWNHKHKSDGYAWNDTVSPLFDLKAALGGGQKPMEKKLIGQKVVQWNEMNASGDAVVKVHMEIYVDCESANLDKPDYSKQKWRLLAEYIHDGTNWPTTPPDTSHIEGCNARNVKMVTWGGPFIALRFDKSKWILYSLSVRPILPNKVEAHPTFLGQGPSAAPPPRDKKKDAKKRGKRSSRRVK